MALETIESAPPSSPRRWVRPSQPDDAEGIVALMRQAGLQPHVDPAQLHWKYWRPREDGRGARSFVLTDGRDLLAHGAIVPGVLRSGANRANAVHMIDWAARRDAVGAGVQLMKHVASSTEYLFGIGGSAQTLKIMPLIGYHLCGTVTGYVRPLSPAALLGRPTRARWKLAPRLARSALWSVSAPAFERGNWRARRLGANELDRIEAILPAEASAIAFLERSLGCFRHALACPIVPVELYAVEQGERVRGYFVLSFVPGQARLADWWSDSDDPADRRMVVHLAVAQVKGRKDLAELATWSSDPDISRSLLACGFHERLSLPIYFRSSRGAAVPAGGVRVQMLDNDAFYLHFTDDELWA